MNSVPSFVAQEEEVAAIIEVPLLEFWRCLTDYPDPFNKLCKKHWSTAFKLQGHVVWGANAMMLNEVRELLPKTI